MSLTQPIESIATKMLEQRICAARHSSMSFLFSVILRTRPKNNEFARCRKFTFRFSINFVHLFPIRATSVGAGAASNIDKEQPTEYLCTKKTRDRQRGHNEFFTLFFFAFDLTIHKLVFYLFTCADGEHSQYFYANQSRHRGRLRYAIINMHIKNTHHNNNNNEITPDIKRLQNMARSNYMYVYFAFGIVQLRQHQALIDFNFVCFQSSVCIDFLKSCHTQKHAQAHTHQQQQ